VGGSSAGIGELARTGTPGEMGGAGVLAVHAAAAHPGVYLVEDTGPAIDGHELDVYLTDAGEVRRFGRRRLRVEILHRADRRGPMETHRRPDGRLPMAALPYASRSYAGSVRNSGNSRASTRASTIAAAASNWSSGERFSFAISSARKSS
jgi:hypothetical protein